MRRDVGTEEEKKEEKGRDGERGRVRGSQYGRVRDSREGNRNWSDNASDTSMLPGLIGWRRRSKMTKKFVIDNEVEEMLVEEERRLEIGRRGERHYEMLLKRSQVESMKNEIDKLSLQKTNPSGFSDSRDRLAVPPRAAPEGCPEGLPRKVAPPFFDKRGETIEFLFASNIMCKRMSQPLQGGTISLQNIYFCSKGNEGCAAPLKRLAIERGQAERRRLPRRKAAQVKVAQVKAGQRRRLPR